MSVVLLVASAVFAFLAAALHLLRWRRLRHEPSSSDGAARSLQARRAIAAVAFLVGGVTATVSAVLRTQEADEAGVNEYQECLDEQQRQHGEPDGGVGDMVDELCERHHRCEHLEGAPEERLIGFTPEEACHVLDQDRTEVGLPRGAGRVVGH